MNTIQNAIHTHEKHKPTTSAFKDTNTIKWNEESITFTDHIFGWDGRLLTESNKQSMAKLQTQESPKRHLILGNRHFNSSFYSKDSLQLDSLKISRNETDAYFSNCSSIRNLIEDRNSKDKQENKHRNKIVYSEWSVGRNILHKRNKPMFEINETKAIKKKLSFANQTNHG